MAGLVIYDHAGKGGGRSFGEVGTTNTDGGRGYGGGGSTAAAPIARDILLEVQRRDKAPTGRQAKGLKTAKDGSPGSMSG